MEHPKLRIRNPIYRVFQCNKCLDLFSLVRHIQCPNEECIEEKRIERLERKRRYQETEQCNTLVK